MLTDNRCVALGRHYGCSCHDNGDALARRVAKLEAAIGEAPYVFGPGLTREQIIKSIQDWADRVRHPALASSGGTGAATKLVDWRKCIDCGHEWPFPSETSHLRCPPCSRSGLREIVEWAVRAGYEYGVQVAEQARREDLSTDHIVAGVLAGERATRDEGAAGKAGSGPMGASEVRPTDPLPVALPSREQAGRADSSGGASDKERARAVGWLMALPKQDYPIIRDAEVRSLAAEFAAIRREAIEEAARVADERARSITARAGPCTGEAQAIAASIRALAGDAPAERV